MKTNLDDILETQRTVLETKAAEKVGGSLRGVFFCNTYLCTWALHVIMSKDKMSIKY
jgi:hypothetical protein